MGKPEEYDPVDEPSNTKYFQSIPSRGDFYDFSSAKKWVRPSEEAQSAKINQTLYDPKKKNEVIYTDNRYNRTRDRLLKSVVFNKFKGDWADSPWGWFLTAAVWFVLFLPFIIFGLFIFAFGIAVIFFLNSG
jgi:Ca2+-dependent lipid-binding protein